MSREWRSIFLIIHYLNILALSSCFEKPCEDHPAVEEARFRGNRRRAPGFRGHVKRPNLFRPQSIAPLVFLPPPPPSSLNARRLPGRAQLSFNTQPPPPPSVPPLHASNDTSSGAVGRQRAPCRAHPPSPPALPLHPNTTPPSLRADSGPLCFLSTLLPSL